MKSYIKGLEDNIAFKETSEEELKIELAAAIKDNTRTFQLVDNILSEVVDLQERLGENNGVI